MLILGLSDIHGSLDFLHNSPQLMDDVRRADIVLIAGDITNFRGHEDAERVVSAVRRHNPNILAVPGNCDLPGVDEYLRTQDINLHCDCRRWDGYSFTGVGAILPCRRHEDTQSREDVLRTCLQHVQQMSAGEDRLIFVAHYPPKSTAVDPDSRGSLPVRDFIEQVQPLLAFSGHIHDAPGYDWLGATVLVNPGSMRDGSYAMVQANGWGDVEVQIKRA